MNKSLPEFILTFYHTPTKEYFSFTEVGENEHEARANLNNKMVKIFRSSWNSKYTFYSIQPKVAPNPLTRAEFNEMKQLTVALFGNEMFKEFTIKETKTVPYQRREELLKRFLYCKLLKVPALIK